MRWDAVIDAIVLALQRDPELTEALGGPGYIYPLSASRPLQVPSITWFIISDVEVEVMNPIRVQFDVWAKEGGGLSGARNMATIERRVREVLVHNTWQRLVRVSGPDVWMEIELVDAQQMSDDGGVVGAMHRQLDYRFTPLRSRYVA